MIHQAYVFHLFDVRNPHSPRQKKRLYYRQEEMEVALSKLLALEGCLVSIEAEIRVRLASLDMLKTKP